MTTHQPVSASHRFAAPALLALAAALLLPAPGTAVPGEGGAETERAPGERERQVLVLGEHGGPHQVFPILGGGGFLGVELLNLTPELRAHFGAPEDAGVMIARVLPDSPAAEAGLRVGDIVTTVDGEEVASSMRLGSEVRRREEGERVGLGVIRQGRLQEFTVTLRERQRQALDVGDFFEWRGEGEGGDPLSIHVAPRVRLRELDPEVWQSMEKSLEAIDWGEMARRFRQVRPDVEKRLEELEDRLRELERELERARGSAGAGPEG